MSDSDIQSRSGISVLCIDDEPDTIELYEMFVRDTGFQPLVAQSGEDGLKVLQENLHNIALIVCDLRMKEMSGFDVRKKSLGFAGHVPFLIVSGFVTREMALAAIDLKISGFYDKPLTGEHIIKAVLQHSAGRAQQIIENRELEAIFLEESSQLLGEMEEALLALDRDRENKDSLNILYRSAHTIKGSGGVLECRTLTKFVHKYEDLISDIRKGEVPLTAQVMEILFKGFDRVKELINSISTHSLGKFNLEGLLAEIAVSFSGEVQRRPIAEVPPSVAPAAPKPTTKQAAKDSITVPINMLDELSVYSGEITVLRNMVNKLVRVLEVRYSGDRDVLTLGDLLDEMHKINSAIQNRIADLRKVPLSSILKPISRIVRDLSRDLKKRIQLVLEGDSLRVDNILAEVCSNSLVHLVRNSADHGIESPEVRVKAGKPEEGTVRIVCREDRDFVRISIKDDGGGLNKERIKGKAIENGLYTESQLAVMSDQQIYAIIFAAGFSTAAKVTDVSGRGVGMDMVKSSVSDAGGEIEIESDLGKGASFTLRLPVPKSVVIINSLLVESAGQRFAIPQEAIVRVITLECDKRREDPGIQHISSGMILRYGGQVFPATIPRISATTTMRS